jgi:acid phosphatase type 7
MILSLTLLATVVVANPDPDPLLKFFPGGFAKRHDTPTFHCTNVTVPTQIRLAYAGPAGMAVSWNTNQKLSKPTVQYGSSKGNLDQKASSDISNTYPTSSTYSNHVVIKGLDIDTTYYYVPQCGDNKNPLSFKTSRDAGDKTPFSFAMVGDMGSL